MPLQCGTWKKRFLATSGPIRTGSKRMLYGAGGAGGAGGLDCGMTGSWLMPKIMRPVGRYGKGPAQPLSAAMIACTASSVSRSSGWLSGSGQCDSLTTTVCDGGWTKMFWP